MPLAFGSSVPSAAPSDPLGGTDRRPVSPVPTLLHRQRVLDRHFLHNWRRQLSRPAGLALLGRAEGEPTNELGIAEGSQSNLHRQAVAVAWQWQVCELPEIAGGSRERGQITHGGSEELKDGAEHYLESSHPMRKSSPKSAHTPKNTFAVARSTDSVVARYSSCAASRTDSFSLVRRCAASSWSNSNLGLSMPGG